MKKPLIHLMLLFSLFSFCYAKQNNTIFTPKNSVINSLKWIEVSGKRLAPQIMLDFDRPFYFERKVDEENMQLELAFLGMNLKDFVAQDTINKIKTLNNLVSSAELFFKKVPSPRVILKINFCRKDILLRWTKMEDPNRLILDIFLKSTLKNLKTNGANFLYAKNENWLDDSGVINLGDFHGSKIPKDIRIVIDAGHGGSDSGAKNFFLQEKDLTLDIARRTKYFLKKKGFNVFLTRNSDNDLSLLERGELANQLKADLLVSIHINAAPGAENASGLETYCLKGTELLPDFRYGGFYFINNQQDKELAVKADAFLSENVRLSKDLAENVQQSLVDFLKSKNVAIVDRGTKKARFRVMLSSEVPVALVEVGFLTNKKEAKKLSIPLYRHMLAAGISRGIQKYIKSKFGS
jgi:N-acetylmuramoyl-L-alanine amidase